MKTSPSSFSNNLLMGVWTLRVSESGASLNWGLLMTFFNLSDKMVEHYSKVSVFSTSTKCDSRSFSSFEIKWMKSLKDYTWVSVVVVVA